MQSCLWETKYLSFKDAGDGQRILLGSHHQKMNTQLTLTLAQKLGEGKAGLDFFIQSSNCRILFLQTSKMLMMILFQILKLGNMDSDKSSIVVLVQKYDFLILNINQQDESFDYSASGFPDMFLILYITHKSRQQSSYTETRILPIKQPIKL